VIKESKSIRYPLFGVVLGMTTQMENETIVAHFGNHAVEVRILQPDHSSRPQPGQELGHALVATDHPLLTMPLPRTTWKLRIRADLVKLQKVQDAKMKVKDKGHGRWMMERDRMIHS
jgi:hypothetical protein